MTWDIRNVEQLLIEQEESNLIDMEDALRRHGWSDEKIIGARDDYLQRAGTARKDTLAQLRRLNDLSDLSTPSSVALQ